MQVKNILQKSKTNLQYKYNSKEATKCIQRIIIFTFYEKIIAINSKIKLKFL